MHPRDRGYISAYLFGAVCPDRRTGAAVVMPEVNTEAMEEHLAEISRRVTAGAHAVLVLDGAGPEALLRRTEWANYVAGLVTGSDPVAVCIGALGPLLSPETLRQVANAGSRRSAHVMLFASPEFLRR